MFSHDNMRYKVAVVWMISFIFMWIIFSTVLPLKAIDSQLNKIENSVQSKDWKQANQEMNTLKKIYNKNRVIIRMNNATEIYTTFEHTLGQLESTVKHNQDSAVEYVGALRESLDFVMKAFSGP